MILGEKFKRDPQHNKLIPVGGGLIKIVAEIRRRAGKLALQQARKHERIDLSQFVEELESDCLPILIAHYNRGYRRQARDLLKQTGNPTKTFGLQQVRKSISFNFNLFRPEIRDYLKNAHREFAESTMRTATRDAKTVYNLVRSQLLEGMSQGEAGRELSRRMAAIFNNPYYAWRIAQNESSRAMHAGQYAVDEASELVTKTEWLASADCCEICAKLNGQQRELGVPFLEKTKGPAAYRKVYYPTAHPGCMCTTKSVIDTSRVTPGAVARLREMARGVG